MFLGLGVEWSLRRAPGMPFLEISATIPKVDIPNIETFYLEIALQMVKKVEKYNGLIIPPFGDVPKDKNIFFTTQFPTDKDVENFIKNGWEKAD